MVDYNFIRLCAPRQRGGLGHRRRRKPLRGLSDSRTRSTAGATHGIELVTNSPVAGAKKKEKHDSGSMELMIDGKDDNLKKAAKAAFYNTGIYGEYDHFQSRSLFNVGTYVNSRDIIAAVGNTGNSDGAHLHYTVYTTGTSNYNTNIMASVFGQNYLSTMMQSHNYTSGNGEPLNKYVYDPTYFYTNNRRGR